MKKDLDTTKTDSKGNTTLGETNGEGPPHDVGDITIYYAAIKSRVRNATQPSGPAGFGFRPRATDIAKVEKKTIGHEVGHGCNVEHHDIAKDAQDIPIPSERCIMEWGNLVVETQGNTKRIIEATVYRPHHNSQYRLR